MYANQVQEYTSVPAGIYCSTLTIETLKQGVKYVLPFCFFSQKIKPIKKPGQNF